MWFISRKGAKLAKTVCFLCLFFGFLSATLSQRLWVLIYASPFDYLLFLLWWMCCGGFSQRRKGCGCYFTLRLMIIFCSFCGECAVLVSRRDAESQRCCPCCVYSLCFEALLSQRLRVLFSLRLMCSYVVYFTQGRKVRKDCVFSVLCSLGF